GPQPATFDLDLVLVGAHDLPKLGDALRSCACVAAVDYIAAAAFPVLKLTCVIDGDRVAVDVTHDARSVCRTEAEVARAPRHTGVAAAALVREYCAFLPELRPLVLVLKQLLYQVRGRFRPLTPPSVECE